MIATSFCEDGAELKGTAKGFDDLSSGNPDYRTAYLLRRTHICFGGPNIKVRVCATTRESSTRL